MSINTHHHTSDANNRLTWAAAGLMILIALTCLATRPAFGSIGSEDAAESAGETVEGRVLKVLSADLDTAESAAGGGQNTLAQRVRVEITTGDMRGYAIDIDHGDLLAMTESRQVEEGDRVLIHVSAGPTGKNFYISDFVRLPTLLLLVLLFAAATILVGRQVGLRSLLSMVYSFSIISLFILPRIGDGQDPVQISIVGAFLAIGPSVYLTYGWSWKTHSALLGLAISLAATGLLAKIFVDWGHLTGLASEEAMLLLFSSYSGIDLRGLALGGILIGTLGVLDDVTIGQSSTTFELKKANPALSWSHLFQHAMVVGRDHIAATVNTLMMAYVAAALPFFLLLMSAGAPLIQTLNRELLAEEIIRTLAGSLGLILAVPITSLIASVVAQRFGPRPVLLHALPDARQEPEAHSG
jgi:uncharacterized membrane protein